MKSYEKSKFIILITLSIFLALNLITNTDHSFFIKLNSQCTEKENEISLDNNNLKISTSSGRIHVDNNWTDAVNAGICTGQGTFSNPYIIKDLEINAEAWGSGIVIENSNKYFKIENCVITNVGEFNNPLHSFPAGIKLNNLSHGTLKSNECPVKGDGIALFNSNNNTIIENTLNLHLGGYGILLRGSSYNYISRNSINQNQIGIQIKVGNYNQFSENILHENEIGIEAYGSYFGSQFIRNTISNSIRYGMIFEFDFSDNLVYLNCFIENNINAYDEGSGNSWDNGVRGNFWDDYAGSDADNDGIGDSPYNITSSAGSQDNFPLMNCPSQTQDGGEFPIELIIIISIIGGSAVIGVGIILFIIRKNRRK